MQNEINGLNEKNETVTTTEGGSKVQTLSLDAPGVANKIAARVLKEIDAYCVQTYDGGHRTHLGASLIGRNCKRYLWYVFRWCLRAATDGRKQRLFNRGHREEARFVEWLEGIGIKVWFENREGFYYHAESDAYGIAVDGEMPDPLCTPILESNPEYLRHVARAKADGLEFPQYRISDVNGHFGGSLDGIAVLPPHWGIDEPVLLEFKTHGTGHKFVKLKENKMPVEKQEHFAQTSTYGLKYGFRYVLYFSICKNDDDLHVEVAKLDHATGQQMILKAESIINSQTPPPKLSESPTYSECGYCDMRSICHGGEPVERNCRSCIHARPIENAQWHCEVHSPSNGPIPKQVIPTGCPDYKAIV